MATIDRGFLERMAKPLPPDEAARREAARKEEKRKADERLAYGLSGFFYQCYLHRLARGKGKPY